MTLDDFQRIVVRTNDPHENRVEHGALGLIGETGEVVDVIKKWLFQPKVNDIGQPPKGMIVEEVGDVLWYCAELLEGLHSKFSDLELERKGEMLSMEDDFKESAVFMVNEAVGIYYLLKDDSTPPAVIRRSIARLCDCATLILRYVGASVSDVLSANITKTIQRYPERAARIALALAEEWNAGGEGRER